MRRAVKVVIIGDWGVGKTSLRRRFLGKSLTENYLPTLGVDISSMNVKRNDEEVTLMFWDLAGQHRFRHIRSGFYKGARIALIVFDVSRHETLDNVKVWVQELIERWKKIPTILIGNKIDLRGTHACVMPEEGERVAAEVSELLGRKVPYIETSALTGENVEKVVEMILKMTKVRPKTEARTIPFI